MSTATHMQFGKLSAAVLLLLTGSVAAFAACFDIQMANQAQIPAGTNVKVALAVTEPPGAEGALREALDAVSGQVSGISFTKVDEEPDDGASILVSFGGTAPNGAESTGQWTSSPGNDGSMRTGTINVYTDQRNCNGAGGLCYNRAVDGYRDAIKRTLIHELMHSLGLRIRRVRM